MRAWSYVETRLHTALRKDKNDRGVRYVTHNTVKLGPKEHGGLELCGAQTTQLTAQGQE